METPSDIGEPAGWEHAQPSALGRDARLAQCRVVTSLWRLGTPAKTESQRRRCNHRVAAIFGSPCVTLPFVKGNAKILQKPRQKLEI